jgi:multidrug efflux pump subunit AcrB
LIPLALTNPFWESLSVTLIFGLLSSTFLVLVAFPYYYLIFESVRSRLIIKVYNKK